MDEQTYVEYVDFLTNRTYPSRLDDTDKPTNAKRVFRRILGDFVLLEDGKLARHTYVRKMHQGLRYVLRLQERDTVLAKYHKTDMGHLNYDAFLDRLQQHYWWDTMKGDVMDYKMNCECASNAQCTALINHLQDVECADAVLEVRLRFDNANHPDPKLSINNSLLQNYLDEQNTSNSIQIENEIDFDVSLLNEPETARSAVDSAADYSKANPILPAASSTARKRLKLEDSDYYGHLSMGFEPAGTSGTAAHGVSVRDDVVRPSRQPSIPNQYSPITITNHQTPLPSHSSLIERNQSISFDQWQNEHNQINNNDAFERELFRLNDPKVAADLMQLSIQLKLDITFRQSSSTPQVCFLVPATEKRSSHMHAAKKCQLNVVDCGAVLNISEVNSLNGMVLNDTCWMKTGFQQFLYALRGKLCEMMHS